MITQVRCFGRKTLFFVPRASSEADRGRVPTNGGRQRWEPDVTREHRAITSVCHAVLCTVLRVQAHGSREQTLDWGCGSFTHHAPACVLEADLNADAGLISAQTSTPFQLDMLTLTMRSSGRPIKTGLALTLTRLIVLFSTLAPRILT